MGNVIKVHGADVWWSEVGSGMPTVLLHPAGADSRAWGPVVDPLAAAVRVITVDRRGHGRTPDVAGPVDYDIMAADTEAFLEEVVAQPVDLVGYSDGAIVALLVALRRPDLVRKLVVIASVFHRDGWLPGVIDTDAPPPDFMADAFAEVSPHPREHFFDVSARHALMRRTEPSLTVDDLGRVTPRTLIVVGDDDEVSLEHSLAFLRGVEHSELAVIPGTSHGLVHEKPALCAAVLLDFLGADAVPTFAPMRRRPNSG